MSRLGVVTGLEYEAACLHRALSGVSVEVETTGGNAAAAEQAVRRLFDAGVTALLSFGFAGGLSPTLRAGSIVVADRVILPDGRQIPSDRAWRDALETETFALPRSTRSVGWGAIYGSLVPVTTASEKRALSERSGAFAVDIESYAVATGADGRVPFAVVRVVVDPMQRTVPPAAVAAMRADGGIDAPALLRSLLRRPGQIPGMIALAGDAAAARRGLRDAALLLAATSIGR